MAALFLDLWGDNLLAEGCGRADLPLSRWWGSRKQSKDMAEAKYTL